MDLTYLLCGAAILGKYEFGMTTGFEHNDHAEGKGWPEVGMNLRLNAAVITALV